MHLTPPEIQYQPLKARGRGYDREDVDKLLEHVAASYEQVWKERDELRARVAELESGAGPPTAASTTADSPAAASPTSSEDVLNEILVSAQRAADQVLDDARQEAERLVGAVREEAKADAEHELEDIRANIERLQSLERYIYSGLRARLEEGLKLIEDGRDSEEAPSSEALAEVESAGAEDRHA
jgi:cell division initiation protein